MKIVVMEVSSLSRPGEREFVLPVVKIGRDNAQCHIVFDRATWPMVSRSHGEFRSAGGKCLLFDANSSFGTFLNGQRVKGSAELRTGALVQFGAGGPILRIQRIETNAEVSEREDEEAPLHPAEKDCQSPHLDQAVTPPPPETQVPEANLEGAKSSGQLAVLELVGDQSRPAERAQINSETTLLGRDPASVFPLNVAAVSRRHAEIRRRNGQLVLVDLGSYNGTLLNGERLSQPALLYDNDRIQLGANGPALRLIDPANPAPANVTSVPLRVVDSQGKPETNRPFLVPPVNPASVAEVFETLVAPQGARADPQPGPLPADRHEQPFLSRKFDQPYLSVGRAPDNDICLDSLQVSVHHARFITDQNGVLVEDKGSTNGVYLNGKRITPGRKEIQRQDVMQIGPFVLQVNQDGGIDVFDTRSKTRIDAININKFVPERSGSSAKLLDEVNLSIQPNEFIGLLGSSGAGKSTLMDVLNGMSRPTDGQVLINNLDLYQHLDSLKHAIGYVPQDDIIHRELSVYRTLYYVARLRLSRDVSRAEINQIINEVLDVTGLTERRDVPVERLSGGQRKRVSIAVELITKPSIIFLDEPTSGLDPATEEKIMRLFRRIAESGRTVVLTTHAVANVHLFDKIVILMRGKLVFYGEPAAALTHFKVAGFKDLYDVLKAPAGTAAAALPLPAPDAPAEQKPNGRSLGQNDSAIVAEGWRLRFEGSELYRDNIGRPLGEINPVRQAHAVTRPRLKFVDAVCQWLTLVRRYIEILARDRITLLVLFGQAPVIAFLTYLVINEKAPRDFPYFMLALVATWFGTSVAAREIIRERAVYDRERMVNLGLLPYVASKMTILALFVGAQCALLLVALKILHYTHLTYLPGRYGGLPQLLVMVLTGTVGIALGLLVSAIVKTSEAATSLVPLLLIPQILFSGMAGLPKGVAKVAGVAMPVTWSFDQMKRLSTLETLNDEGSVSKYMEEKARQETKKTQAALEEYNREVSRNIEDYGRRVAQYSIELQGNPGLAPPQPPSLGKPPQVDEMVQTDDLREFVSFTHPWGGTAFNTIGLFLILFVLIAGTVLALRAQDKG